MERKGVEPSTSALRTHKDGDASVNGPELTATPSAACTVACTDEGQIVTDHASSSNAMAKGEASTDDALSMLAAALLNLDPIARAKLATMLLKLPE